MSFLELSSSYNLSTLSETEGYHFQVEIAESDDYKYVVTCINEDLVFMNENAKEVICNTSTGSYHAKIDLSPCLRVIEQIYP